MQLNRKKEEDGSGPELTRKDVIKCIQSERVRFRGVNLSGLNLSKLVSSQECGVQAFTSHSMGLLNKIVLLRAFKQAKPFMNFLSYGLGFVAYSSSFG